MAFTQGISGLNVSAAAIDVTSHNIANVQTVGFKRSDGIFADMYSSAMFTGSGRNNIGYGASTAQVRQDFKQGGKTDSSNPLDMAIEGNGFFQVQLANGTKAYTRNGQFTLDKDGYVENAQHNHLMGFPAIQQATLNRGHIFGGDPVELQVDIHALVEATATTEASEKMNLGSAELSPADQTPPGDDITDPLFSGAGAGTLPYPSATSYNGVDQMKVYDSMGNDIDMTIYYVRQPGQNPMSSNWDVYIRLDTDINTAGNPPYPDVPLTHMGTLTFDTSGRLDTFTPGAGITSNSNGHALLQRTGAQLKTGADDLAIDIDFSEITQFGQKTAPESHKQNGYTAGKFVQLEVSDDGVIEAEYTNGKRVAIGQVALANFDNPYDLDRVGDNLFMETYGSGQPSIGKPMTGMFGTIKANYTEDSNVDLTKELVNLIVFQRNYQANAQSIRTQDTILQTVVNLR